MSWQPTAEHATLKARAWLQSTVRSFFEERGVMEVDTPILSQHATVDRHIDSLRVAGGGWLHTSPEFAMKRLLAAGSGPIYQLCHVFRAGEAGRFHNPEFTLLEWYRPGWDHLRLMDEVEELIGACIAEVGDSPLAEVFRQGDRTPGASGRRGAVFPRLSYRDAFLAYAGVDPFAAELAELRARCATLTEAAGERDFFLDLLMSHVVGPELGAGAPCFLHDFPASQAALARVRQEPDGTVVAERFELFWRGSELANGFHELLDADEQQARFRADQAWRLAHDRVAPPYDVNLIAALQAGLPACAGVALGIDRLLMLLLNLRDVASAMPFGWDRA